MVKTQSTLALEGVRILDLSHLPPGWFATMMLADMGAEVTRVEGPAGVPAGIEGNDLGYGGMNRNKRSIGLNLKQKGAQDVLLKLVEKADVFVSDFRPETTKRLGVDYQTAHALNPRLIYCAMSGYGSYGPYKDMPGHDLNYIAMAGALDFIGEKDGPPVIPLNFVGDSAGGSLHAVIGILTALVAREKTGKGQFVDIAYSDGVVSMLGVLAHDHLNRGTSYTRGVMERPWYNVYKTADGKYITLGCFEPWLYENLCRALGREDLIPYQNAEGTKQQEIQDWMTSHFLTKSRDEWFDLLRKADVCVGSVNSMKEVFADPHVIHREMIVEVDGPRGKERHVGIPIKLSDTPGKIRTVAPIPGQDTKQVLSELGYGKDKVEELLKAGAISLPVA